MEIIQPALTVLELLMVMPFWMIAVPALEGYQVIYQIVIRTVTECVMEAL